MDGNTMQKNVQKKNKHKVKRHIKKHVSKISSDRKFVSSTKKTRKSIYDPDEEARLERIVFGDPSDIISNLDDESTVSNEKPHDNDNQDQNSTTVRTDEDVNITEKDTVWKDDDDYSYTMDIALNAQNHKLACARPEKLYVDYLANKYKALTGTPSWAKLDKVEVDDTDSHILKHSCHLETSKAKNLPKDIIDIKALTALNRSTHNEGHVVTSVEFHPSSTVALVAGTSGVLSLFQVDGHTNNKLHSMCYEKFPISKCVFMKEGTEVLLGSRYYAHCYTYNLMNGKNYRLPLPHNITNMENYEVSPDGNLIALCGRLGEIHLLHGNTKELINTFKMNSKCRTLAFIDNKTLVTHGDGSEAYVWDINTRKCLNRAIDDGCLSCTSLAVSPQFLATGSAQGIVNLYDIQAILKNKNPTPLKIMKNLVTSITNLKFNPTSEILAVASEKKPNAFKMLHISSLTVFSNFPTFQTNIGMPQTISFSPNSGYLSISNKTGSALLYRLRHYGNY